MPRKPTTSKRYRRRGVGVGPALKAGIGWTPRGSAAKDLSASFAESKDFQPLLRPDGPFYGSGT